MITPETVEHWKNETSAAYDVIEECLHSYLEFIKWARTAVDAATQTETPLGKELFRKNAEYLIDLTENTWTRYLEHVKELHKKSDETKADL